MSLNIGKGFYIWGVLSCESGLTDKIVATAKAAKLGHVLIKVAGGVIGFNFLNGLDLVKPLVPALKEAGIEPWGWQYVYGNNPKLEADIAIKRIKELGLVGFVVNAEREYRDRSDNKAAATTYMNRLRAGVGLSFPIGLSSYRYPSYHPAFPWWEFLNAVDINMPQVYWMQATNSAWQLQRSVDEFKAMTIQRPIIPTGAAFGEWGWLATAAQITAFLRKAEELKLPAVNFWSWQHARAKAGLWEAVAEYPWPAPFPVVPAPLVPEVAKGVDMLIVKTALNLRNSPTIDAPIITLIPAGEKVELKEIGIMSGGYPWLKVRMPRTGQVGWCASVISGKPSVQVQG